MKVLLVYRGPLTIVSNVAPKPGERYSPSGVFSVVELIILQHEAVYTMHFVDTS